jgi:hypothetical protein
MRPAGAAVRIRGVLTVRAVEAGDLPVVWALSVLPNVDTTADPSVPFSLRPALALPSDVGGLRCPRRPGYDRHCRR